MKNSEKLCYKYCIVFIDMPIPRLHKRYLFFIPETRRFGALKSHGCDKQRNYGQNLEGAESGRPSERQDSALHDRETSRKEGKNESFQYHNRADKRKYRHKKLALVAAVGGI